MNAPRILILDGNVPEIRAKQAAAVGYDAGSGYARVLRRINPELRCDVIYAADADPKMPAGAALADYDGAAITGSALSVCTPRPEVTRQIDLAKAVFDAGVPLFGSCWGLQVAVTAAGGVVEPNPLGREFGFARRIALTPAGRAHPLFDGKPAVFESGTVHRDSIRTLPSGSTSLAYNEMGLQAAVFTHGGGQFWGVQYHPEYDYIDVAAAAARYSATLVADGIFQDLAAVDAFVADLNTLQAQPQNRALLWKHGLGPAVQDVTLRIRELRNWIQSLVVPRFTRAR
jgi:GMP synthase (glutamine-hydrolysing)